MPRPRDAGPSILVERSRGRLTLRAPGRAPRHFPAAVGRNLSADKAVEGDEATPLGAFRVCAKNPRSRYTLSVCLSYPNAEDADRGLRDGLIDAAEHAAIHAAIRERRIPPQTTRLGGEIYIHGGRGPDGTRGCIALDDAAIREVFETVTLGTPVRIVP